MTFAFGLAIGLFLFFDGLYQLVKGCFPGDQSSYAEYIPETVEKAARLSGIVCVLMGIIVFVKELQEKGYFTIFPSIWTYYIIFAVLLILMMVIVGLTMKKK